MKKVTKEEAEKMTVRLGSSTVVRSTVMNMQVGEILQIEPSDWHQSKGPGQMLGRLKKTTGRSFTLKTVVSGGWLVERVS